MGFNFLEDILIKNMQTKEFLSFDMFPDKYLCMYLDIPDLEMKFIIQDEKLNIFTEMLASNLAIVEKLYSEKNVFFMPELIFKPSFTNEHPRLGFKIGMMNKEKYEQLMADREKAGN